MFNTGILNIRNICFFVCFFSPICVLDFVYMTYMYMYAVSFI